MKNLSKREKVLLLAVFALAVIYLFMNYVYSPLNEKIEELQAQSDQLAIQVEDLQLKQNKITELETEIIALQKSIDKDHKDIFTVWDDPQLLVYLEKVLDKYSMIKQISFSGDSPQEGYRSGVISLGLDTDYENLQKMMKEFEKKKYFNTVEAISLSPTTYDKKSKSKRNGPGYEEIDTSNLLTINLSLKFYSQDIGAEFPDEYDFMKGKFGKENIFIKPKK